MLHTFGSYRLLQLSATGPLTTVRHAKNRTARRASGGGQGEGEGEGERRCDVGHVQLRYLACPFELALLNLLL